MPRAARLESPSSIYHVVTRGSSHQIIFEDNEDRAFFVKRMVEIANDYHADLYSWCLMDNHVHLLVRIPFDNLSQAMHALFAGYAGYFNRVHGRTGSLFENRFKSEPVTTDRYLMTVVRYIHYNPVKAGLSRGLDYRWSSYSDYVSNRSNVTNTTFVLEVFGGIEEFKCFHETDGKSDNCLDIAQAPKTRLSDGQAYHKANELLGDNGAASIRTLPRGARRRAVLRLKEGGLSIRQIQRLTGLSLGTISQAGKPEECSNPDTLA